MTEKEIKVANMLEKLEKLKQSSLSMHGDSIAYQLCELLQEIINDIYVK